MRLLQVQSKQLYQLICWSRQNNIFSGIQHRACPHYYWQIAKQPKWSIEVWATQLAGLLTGKAIAAYANLLKLLNHMRQSFKRPEELYHNWGDWLRDHFGCWTNTQNVQLGELIIWIGYMRCTRGVENVVEGKETWIPAWSHGDVRRLHSGNQRNKPMFHRLHSLIRMELCPMGAEWKEKLHTQDQWKCTGNTTVQRWTSCTNARGEKRCL